MATSKQEHSLLQILQERFTSLENVRTLAIDSNRELLSFLLESSEFRERFFTRVDSVVVFEKDKLLDFLKLRVLSKSYTAFSNKIGLQLESSFETTSKVVLNFPFKDCILKGGQSRDEQKSKEIFFNEVLEKSEIDVLFSKKVLYNFELVECQDSKQPTQRNNSSSFSHCERSEAIYKKQDSSIDCHDFATAKSRNDEKENAGLKECLKAGANLLIKGNNLLCLHSLKKKFANQVKLIYIDPPYNTGNDSFNYNDNFNHSTWLTFMKNRLEIAREFLSEDGVIFIQCDDNEQAYLKVLCDEIFNGGGGNNFVSCFVWRKKYGGGKGAKLFVDTHEYILIYGKNKTNLLFNPLARNEKQLEAFKFEDEYVKERGKYYTRPLKSGLDERKTLVYPIECPDGSIIETQWICARETFQQLKDEGRIVFKLLKNKKYNVYKKFYENDMSGVLQESIIYDLAFNADAKLEIKKLFNIDEGRDTPFSAPKPEKLLQRILELATNENDLVMDFFAGSGTTLAVAHKMKRRWIGIEQMEYIESITKERLKKVINGEQGGISKAVGWSGGGSFIYCELMPLNAVYKERIKNLACHTDLERSEREVSKNAESKRDFSPTAQNDKEVEKELEKLYKELESKAFVDYRVDIQAMLQDKEFHALSLDEKLKVLYAILDSNMDYVLYDDIDDSEYGVSKELKELNRIFYGDNDE